MPAAREHASGDASLTACLDAAVPQRRVRRNPHGGAVDAQPGQARPGADTPNPSATQMAESQRERLLSAWHKPQLRRAGRNMPQIGFALSEAHQALDEFLAEH